MNIDSNMTITDKMRSAFLAIQAEQEELRQRGYEVAVDSRALRPEPAQLEALEEAARGRLRARNIELYDPVKNPDDKAREEYFNKLRVDAGQQEEALQHSHAKVRDCREREAEARTGEEPSLGLILWLLAIVATFALSGTLIPTLIDTLTTSPLAEETIHVVAIVVGTVFGLFVTVSIVLSYKLGRSQTAVGLSGLVGGLVIAIGFFVFRCHLAQDFHDYLVAIGLATVEVGAIVTLEWIGVHQRRMYAEWLIKKQEHNRSMAQLDAAQVEEKRRQEVLNHTKAEQQSHIAYLEERSIRRLRAPELEDAAVRAIRQGYLAGIESNRGTIQAA